ncbi:TIGR03618 family F420-dependent PPOX class oxidoreductase [Myxococcota bacterium]|nr:TIGR03618 family F420-dependent PPOX class oxidoreductase [Myxococcota bacterium]
MTPPDDSLFTPEQATFLSEHNIAALATGRRDGSPQLSHILYDYDGHDIVTSIKSYTAKWHNVLRQPRVAMLVHEGRKQLVLYGRAEAIADDPERIELTARIFRRMSGNPDFAADAPFIAKMNEQKRTILRIRADKASMND